MDPDATLAEIKSTINQITEVLAEITEREDAEEESYEPVDYDVQLASLAVDLAESVEVLDQWITSGGFLPTAWRK